MRRIILAALFIAITAAGVVASNPSRADGWQDYSLMTPPYCGGSLCPTPREACLAIAGAWWNASQVEDKLLNCRLLTPTKARATVVGLCCGDTNNGDSSLTCDAGREPDTDGTGRCVPARQDPRGCQYQSSGGNEGACEVSVGNPIMLAEGNKHERVVDFATPGPNVLAFVRTYNSHFKTNVAGFPMPLGIKWQSNFDRYLVNTSSAVKTFFRPDGTVIKFTLVGSVWTPPADLPVKLAQSGTDWVFTDIDDTVETYNSSFKLTTITQRNGYQQALTYDVSGYLSAVTDSYDRSLSFTYTGARLTTMVAADGGVYTYSYDQSFSNYGIVGVNDRLIGVTYPALSATDGGANPTVTYHYEDPALSGYLTGITDERGVRYATWSYNSDGRATSSEHAGGADETTVAYNPDGTRTVTNALGQQTIYSYTAVQGVKKLSLIARQASVDVPAATESYSYDTNGYMASRTDFAGKVTSYVHDARGLQTSRIEGDGTADARTITTSWNTSFRVPDSIAGPGKTTSYTYDGQGRVLTRTETDTTSSSVPYSTNGNSRTWTYSWDSTGLLQTVDGPRTDVSDITTYGWTDGVLTSVTNALGQATDITAHDARGLPTSITDPNGVMTTLAYNQRGWLVSVTVGGNATTQFDYNASGDITAIQQPDGSRLAYEYDDARRLMAVENNAGERIEYALDSLGNRTGEQVKDSSGTIVKTLTRTYDTLGRLLSNIGAGSQTTAYAYDDDSNLVTLTDPLNGATAQSFDALNRLIQSTDPMRKATAYAYDGQDNLTTVTDALSHSTGYVYDGLGNLIQETSPDTGTSVYEYDAAGNRTQATDARGVVAEYSYDEANRLTAIHYPAASGDDIAYSYDDATSGHYGIGRLASLTDKSGSTSYVYDARGNAVEETRVIGSQSYVTSYSYSLTDQLDSVVYPSGRVVNYSRDALGRVQLVTTQANASASPVTVASGIAYEPFGPVKSLTFGNGLVLTYSYDQDYRLTDIDTAQGSTVVQDLSIVHDGADNITAITDNLDSSRSQSFTYDPLYRLLTASSTGTYGSITYSYDEVGNRLTMVDAGGTATYSYATGSNLLSTVTQGSNVRDLTYTANGNLTEDDRPGGQALTFTYDQTDRFTELSLNGTPAMSNRYNALGERVSKSDGTTDQHFHYDGNGHLLAETDGSGTLQHEYIWLDGVAIAELVPGGPGSSPTETELDNSDIGAVASGSWSTETRGSGYIGANYRQHSLEVPQGGTTVDNSSPQFSALGAWTTEISPSGFEGADYLSRNSAIGNGAQITIDNVDPGFSTVGVWTSTTDIWKFYIGTNYLLHAPNQLAPDGITVDNTDVGFQLYGTWSTDTSTPRYGADARFIQRNVPSPASIVVDNGGTGTSKTGAWTVSTGSPRYGANFEFHAAGTGTNVYTWVPTIPSSQNYNVYAYWFASATTASNAKYTIYHSGGSTQVTANQKVNGGFFNLLGTFAFDPGQNHRVELSDDADGNVVADVIVLTPVDSPNSATWTPTIPQTGQYGVYAFWKALNTRTIDVPYTIYHDNGSTTVTVDQTINGGKWNLLGTYSMSPGQNEHVTLAGLGTVGTYVIADAIQLVPAGSSLPMATWTPTIPARDQYQVYVTWGSACCSIATDAPYSVVHEGGSTLVRVNQSSGRSTLLGTFIMAPGQNHRVDLGDQANNRIMADSARFVPVVGPKSATWTMAPAQTGSYRVYAKWPASSANATDAKYTVTYEGGSRTVTVNQRVNGGQWNLLGTFPMNAVGTGYKVDLADSSASGKVVADAIYYVRDSAPVDSFTWTPDITTAGDYQLYARWTASSANSSTAQYTVVHDGDTSLVTANQKQNGGQWNLLGTWSFAPGAGHQVTLTASSDGNVVADAIKLVGTGPAPADLVYLHSDQIGLPQKITDAAQTVIWDRVQDPFGRQVSLTNSGGIDTSLRFPGQQADPDTGFAYNYFRDYDPTLGRYIQPDPIGLWGGVNRYAYVGGSPVARIDFEGLDPDSPTSRSYWGRYTSWGPGNMPYDQAARHKLANWLYNLFNPPQPQPWQYGNACHVDRPALDRLFSESASFDDNVEQCKSKCDYAYNTQMQFCNGLASAQSRRECRVEAFEMYAQCLRNCR